MEQSPVLRLLDANFNRTREALRVIEDGLRFCHSETRLAPEIRKMRHAFTKAMVRHFGAPLVKWRDTGRDRGKDFSHPSPATVEVLLRRNFSRVEESLRTIEEYSKAMAPDTTPVWARLRFGTYELEKKVCAALMPVLPRKPFLCAALSPETADALCGKKSRGRKPGMVFASRGKTNDAEFLGFLRLVRKFTPAKTPVIAESRPDIALLAGADGVLLGPGDLSPSNAKKIFPAGAIGVRCASWKEFCAVRREPLDFLVVEGNFSGVKTGGICFLTKVRKNSTLTIVAGMNVSPLNEAETVNAGADGVMMVARPHSSSYPVNAIRKPHTATRRHGQKA